MLANMYSILAFGTPLLAVPVALVFGLRKTLLGVLTIVGLMLIGPYIYFGVWGLFEGAGLWDTFSAVSLSTPAMAVIAVWMLAWAAAYATAAIVVRLVWIHWKGRCA